MPKPASYGLGIDLPACSRGPLGEELLATAAQSETFRFTCMGCGKTRVIEVAADGRMPRFLA